jgi:protein-S-isoprenylcysteine O-methyltransferase Ste14/rhodanese-related sulfurtransferase
MAGIDGKEAGALLTVLNLVIGGEIITVAAGAKPIAPWKIRNLPENTWIVDVRTKPEFNWNRLQGAESFPWGTGVIEAAAKKLKDVPVLVICFSGHRSPAVAVTIRRLGFETVYNLNWGLLYLILLERGRKRAGPFGLTRSNQSSNLQAQDFRGISAGYVIFALLTLLVAPLENAFLQNYTSWGQVLLGAIFVLGGLLIGFSSFRALGENFRFFAAPKIDGSLITRGVYSRIRHPMYTATVMLLLGYVICFGSLFAIPFWMGCAVLYAMKAAKEEPLLMEHYPEYVEYSRRTFKFIPFIW